MEIWWIYIRELSTHKIACKMFCIDEHKEEARLNACIETEHDLWKETDRRSVLRVVCTQAPGLHVKYIGSKFCGYRSWFSDFLRTIHEECFESSFMVANGNHKTSRHLIWPWQYTQITPMPTDRNTHHTFNQFDRTLLQFNTDIDIYIYFFLLSRYLIYMWDDWLPVYRVSQ